MADFRYAVMCVAALLTVSMSGSHADAEDYPARPVRIVVPFGPGGPADVVARQIGSILQENLSQPFVVENRAGAGGVIGTLEVAKAPADGYTLLMMSNTQTAMNRWCPSANMS